LISINRWSRALGWSDSVLRVITAGVPMGRSKLFSRSNPSLSPALASTTEFLIRTGPSCCADPTSMGFVENAQTCPPQAEKAPLTHVKTSGSFWNIFNDIRKGQVGKLVQQTAWWRTQRVENRATIDGGVPACQDSVRIGIFETAGIPRFSRMGIDSIDFGGKFGTA
jgi:hypothetical protein